jgi:hypothetical protein
MGGDRAPDWRAGPAIGAALAAATFATGCELTSIELADVADVIVAEVYLRPGAGTHVAFLHRTLPGRDGSLRVEDATLIVRDHAGQWMTFERAPQSVCATNDFLEEDVAGSCYVAADEEWVRPGSTLDLEVRVPDGRRMLGRATVPGAFRIEGPSSPACVVEGTSLELVWTRSEGAWAYQADALFTGLAAGLAERGVAEPPDTLRLLGLAIGANDTTMAFPRDFGVFDRYQLDLDLILALQEGLPSGARAEIVIAAVDRNYVNWARGGNFNPSGQVRVSSLTGDGVGVFGVLLGRGLTLVAPGPEADGLPPCGGG